MRRSTRRKPHAIRTLWSVPKVWTAPERPARFNWPDNAYTTIGRISGRWPAVHISPEAHGKMWALVQQSDIEVGWLSSCRQLENGDIVIDDVFVPGQICTVVSTDITPAGEAELLGDLLSTNRRDVIQSLSCWGHSHADMTVYASGTDEKQTQSFLRRHAKRGSQFFLRVIANKKGEFYCTVYLLGSNVIVNNPTLHAEPPDASLWKEWAEEQLRTKVERQSLTGQMFAANIADFEFEKVGDNILQRWLQIGYINPEVYDQVQTRKLELLEKQGEAIDV